MKRIISIMSIVLIMIVTFMLGGFTCFKLLDSDNQYKIIKVTNDKEEDNKESVKKDDDEKITNNKSNITKEKTTSKDNKQELDNKNETNTNKKNVLTIQDAKGFNNADTVGGNYDNKYRLEPGGYFMWCSNGHSIYTMYGDYDCGQCQIEYERKLREENEATDFDWEGNVDWDKYE